ncbi:hypothetical protein BYT27DRAFT_7106460 [Phlegmacium glaucopus]|nr:hypothetical protein BYT27DRAFT_7106460 [Phlegmacium glaucopus]
MLVDNPLLQPLYFSVPPTQSSSHPEYTTDFSDIFDTDLFNSTFAAPSSTTSGSRGSTPQNLLTPPQEALPTSFPEIHDDDTANQFYALFDDDLKAMNNPLALTSTSIDFMGVNGFDGTYGGATGGAGVNYNIDYGMGMDMSNMGMSIPPIDDPMQMRGIDPQLVDTPSAVSDHDDEPEEEQEPSSPPDAVEQPEQEKLTLTIAPVKVGGFGKARKGTVQSGGVVKKTPSAYANKEKENPLNILPSAKKSVPPKVTKLPPTYLANTSPVSGLFLTGDNSMSGTSEAGDRDDDDDLPQDWRPPPEVLAKMTSKEKRQLRNKISARNFRVRRKEYISTLEGDIAERDRLLDHFRTKLGSQESENLALRQEIAALKKALLDGRGGPINLPPPAPLPEHSAAETLATSNTNISTSVVQSSPLVTANTQKDLPSSPRMTGPRFWGGVGMGGGITPVHTTLVPDISTIVRNGLQENMNPSLNTLRGNSAGNGIVSNKGLGFDGFADLNPFTMKTLDAYRMHLWGKMAAQQQIHQQNQTSQTPQNPSGLASKMRPHFFAPSPKANLLPSSSYGSTLSALLSGKHNIPYTTSLSTSTYPTPPTSPLLLPKGGASLPLSLLPSLPSSQSSLAPSSSSSSQKEREKEQQHAMLAAIASQTVCRKLGNAFWDAFTGSSSASTSSSSSTSHGDWDADKVRKVLEGKAVLRVVDVEPATISAATSASIPSTLNIITPPASPKVHHSRAGAASRSSLGQSSQATEDCRKMQCKVTEILEESMRSLSLGKKM